MTAAAAPAQVLDGSYVDWPAIFAGAVVSVAVATLFTTFGAALGLSSLPDPGEGFSFMLIVSALWVVVTLVASYMTGGYIAGRMRRRVDKASADEVTVRDGINGLVVWGLGTIAGLVLLSAAVSATVSAVGTAASVAGQTVGTVATAAGSVVGGAAQGALAAVGAAVPEDAVEDPVGYISDTLMRPDQVPAGTANTEEMARQTAAILGNVLRTGEISDSERAYLVSAVAAQTGLSPAEVNTRVDQAIEGAQTARAEAAQLVTDAQAEAERLAAEAEQLAQDAAETARVSAILTAFLLTAASLVAAAAAYIGAVRGGRHRDEGRIFGGLAYRG
ncbi:hypothetical protein GEU84_001600 [Fertoebacter nigrum]|uniref:ATP synthase F0 subunit B n=2 Tax=Fertoeibacter niger TaxID=2656921 RepID=A0A8X8GYZ8_9RHOB|nr:hypothetical protein [Fertoeibacter niger]